MGFSPVDAHAAFLNSVPENGFAAQTATEPLLSQAGQKESTRPSTHPPERERRRNADRDTDSDRAARPQPTRIDSRSQPPNPSQTHPQSKPPLDITAEKLSSRASEIGRGLFSKANALWKEGKERAVKMYEERAATANAANGAPGMRDHAGGEMGPLTQGSRPPRAKITITPTLPNSFISKEHREAALRERGLLPPSPRKDFSEQEREADEYLGCVPSPVSMNFHGSSEAERLKASWLAMNRASESSDSERGPPGSPYLQRTRSHSSSVPSPDADILRRSGEGKANLSPAGRI
jgi:hypothetical protein